MNSLALNRKSIRIEYRGIFPIYFAPCSSLVVITCSKKSPERVQSAAEYSPIISKHRTPKIHGICSRQKQTSKNAIFTEPKSDCSDKLPDRICLHRAPN